ncbi:glycosyltransferase family 4 protein [Anabaena cylindrica UHCC 0172]|uniref:glycosyltransferase family 4 protein n=1 Tax=Anabaena cylindrica TaxID=1165 RepID=UPI002B21255F|nr:glycosyltransferase family 4 protein [Anabaena cylindrica]MEA5553512.1 glycosyltransferase family 4 protein [Anabaena cylindrica UHCC 0172]
MNTLKVNFYSIVPSPYQRDLFYDLSQIPGINITVYYLEAAYNIYPWPKKPLNSYEKVLPGFVLSWGGSRFHVNWHLPNINQSDVIVINGYMNTTAQLLLRLYGRQIPCVFWGEKIVGSAGGLKSKLQHLFAESLTQCSAIAAIGSVAEADYNKKYPGKLIVNIPYYCDLNAFNQNLPQRPRTPIKILFCGQMIARKGVDILLQAFNRLIEYGLQVKLLLVGQEAELPQMLELLPEQTRQNIEYAGFQAPEDLPEFFSQADLFVLPSRYDGWGVVVNQAVGAGLPIICSDAVGAAYDLIKPGENGYLFPSENIDALVEILKNYIQHPGKIQIASAVSLQISELISPHFGAQRWCDLLKKLI